MTKVYQLFLSPLVVNPAFGAPSCVTASVQRVSAMVTSITAEATQELSHIEEANHLVGQLDVVTGQSDDFEALRDVSAPASAAHRRALS